MNGPVPFWALMRAMFPVAESLGDLIYRRDGATAQNLRSVLEKESNEVRAGYVGKAAILPHLYRHSLTHHDELRVVTCAGRTASWKVSSDNNSRHLDVRRLRPDAFRIEFQPRAFHEDILDVCKRAGARRWGGEDIRHEWQPQKGGLGCGQEQKGAVHGHVTSLVEGSNVCDRDAA